MTDLTHSDAFNAILSEIAYQDQLSNDPDRPDMLPVMSAGERLLAMQHNLNEAIFMWYRDSAPYEETAEYIRKVTALGFRFMEDYSAPLREEEVLQ